MLVKCIRCYGSNHLERDCISVTLAGLHTVRPKCRVCHGWGHSPEHCPSSRVRYAGCTQCGGRSHHEAMCPSPLDSCRFKLAPRCTLCEGWGHNDIRCPLNVVVSSDPTPPKGLVDPDVALRAQYLWSLSHAAFEMRQEQKDAGERLSQFYMAKMRDNTIEGDVRVQEERKFCRYCSTLQVGNVTSITRLYANKNLRRKPTIRTAIPRSNTLQGSVVSHCLHCGECMVEPGKLKRKKIPAPSSSTGGVGVVAAAEKRKKKKKKKQPVKLATVNNIVPSIEKNKKKNKQSHSSLQDFLKAL